MAEPKVAYRQGAEGRHEIGVQDGKLFVPFATLDAARYQQLADNEADKAGGGDDDDNGKGA